MARNDPEIGPNGESLKKELQELEAMIREDSGADVEPHGATAIQAVRLNPASFRLLQTRITRISQLVGKAQI